MHRRHAVCLLPFLLALAVAVAGAPAQAPVGPRIDPAAKRVLRRGIDALRALTAIEIEVTPCIGEAAPAKRDESVRRLPLPAGAGFTHRVLMDWSGRRMRLRIDQQDGNRLLRTLIDDGKTAALLDHVRREHATDEDWAMLYDPVAHGVPHHYIMWHELDVGALPHGIKELRLVGEDECDGVVCDVVEAEFDLRPKKPRAKVADAVQTMRERFAIARGDGLLRRWCTLPPADVAADPNAGFDASLMQTAHVHVRALAPIVDDATLVTRQPAGFRRVEARQMRGMLPQLVAARDATRRSRARIREISSPRHAYLRAEAGDILADAAVTTTDGEPFTLAALRGRAIVILVWDAVGPAEQRAALAALRELHVWTAASGAAVTFVAVQGWDSWADDGRAQAAAAGLQTIVVTRGEALARAWRVVLKPTWIVLDPSGALVFAAAGALAADDEELLAAIEKARPK